MEKTARQLSLVSICLIVMPWSTVVVTHIAYLLSSRPILFDSRDASEIRSLGYAVQRYKQKYGEFPPDLSSADVNLEIDQHLAKIFPERDPELDMPRSVSTLGPHNALYFWLQGFSNDPELPLTGAQRGWKPLFRFKITRFARDEYFPVSSKAPYIYFRADAYDHATYVSPQYGTARPYASKTVEGNLEFARPYTYQIICAGKDGHYGTKRLLSARSSFGAHVDNLTNFLKGPVGDSTVAFRRAQLQHTRNMGLLTALLCLGAFPVVLMLRRKQNGVHKLRRLIRQQAAKPHSGEWAKVLLNDRCKYKSQAISRMAANTADDKKRVPDMVGSLRRRSPDR